MRRAPGSQSRALLEQKREWARKLLADGLATRQVAMQLRCSPAFVRQVRREMQKDTALEEPA